VQALNGFFGVLDARPLVSQPAKAIIQPSETQINFQCGFGRWGGAPFAEHHAAWQEEREDTEETEERVSVDFIQAGHLVGLGENFIFVRGENLVISSRRAHFTASTWPRAGTGLRFDKSGFANNRPSDGKGI
jgi:hypothetical protein